MKQHNAPVGEFRQPEIEIMRDGFVGMIAVYVKKVDRPISKSLILPRQIASAAVPRMMNNEGHENERELAKNFISVESSLGVSGPRVDRIAPSCQAQSEDCFAKSRIGHPVMGP